MDVITNLYPNPSKSLLVKEVVGIPIQKHIPLDDDHMNPGLFVFGQTTSKHTLQTKFIKVVTQEIIWT